MGDSLLTLKLSLSLAIGPAPEPCVDANGAAHRSPGLRVTICIPRYKLDLSKLVRSSHTLGSSLSGLGETLTILSSGVLSTPPKIKGYLELPGTNKLQAKGLLP